MNNQSVSILARNTSRSLIGKIRAYVELARPEQYVKNFLVFLPLVVANDPQEASTVGVVFILFCLLSSCVYAINDAFDAEHDMQHPEKCKRPIPSKRLTEREAFIYAAFLGSSALIIAILIVPVVAIFCVAYVVINVFYSMAMKDLAIVDIILVSSGFVIRFMAGDSIVLSADSSWMIGPIFLVSLSLAVGKRLVKIGNSSDNSKKMLRVPAFYSRERLAGILLTLSNITVVIATCIVIMNAALVEQQTGLSVPLIISFLSVCVIIFSRVLYLMIFQSQEPSKIFSKDKATIAGCSFVVLAMVIQY